MFRVRLLVKSGAGHPRIAEYRGQGSLRAWLRVMATRVALNATKRKGRELLAGDDWLSEASIGERDPEVEYLKWKYRAEFKVALEAVVATLSPGERNFLRYAYVEKLEIDAIGAIYGVHRTTAGRRLAAAREKLVHRLRAELAKTLGLSVTERASFLALIESRLELSLERLLRET